MSHKGALYESASPTLWEEALHRFEFNILLVPQLQEEHQVSEEDSVCGCGNLLLLFTSNLTVCIMSLPTHSTFPYVMAARVDRLI